MRLANRIALVTGSDSGIGQQIAITFAREGADVLVDFHHDAALFLASDDASYVTGSSYFVDGGLMRNIGGT